MAKLLVVLIHGTFHNRFGYADVGETFIRKFQEGLPEGLDSEFCQYVWSGKNKAKARNSAASFLVDYARAHWEPSGGWTHVVLIGHSHGGNVAHLAASKIEEILGCKVSVCSIGTPLMTATTDDLLERLYKRPLKHCMLLFAVIWLLRDVLLFVLGLEVIGLSETLRRYDEWLDLSYFSLLGFLPFLLAPSTRYARQYRSELFGMQAAEERFNDSRHLYIYTRSDEVAKLFGIVRKDRLLKLMPSLIGLSWLGMCLWYAAIALRMPMLSQQAKNLRWLIVLEQATLNAAQVIVVTAPLISLAAFGILFRLFVYGVQANASFIDAKYTYVAGKSFEILPEEINAVGFVHRPLVQIPTVCEPVPTESFIGKHLKKIIRLVLEIQDYIILKFKIRRPHTLLKYSTDVMDKVVDFVRESVRDRMPDQPA